jgi:hypothetical protein
MAALNVIGIVSGLISMAPMLGSMLPDKADSETNVRIGVGTSINKDDTTGESITHPDQDP